MSFKYIFHNDFSPHFTFLLSNERLDLCDLKKNKVSKGLTIQINVHSLLVTNNKVLKSRFTQNENCHNLLNIMSVQACMNFFLLWNIIWEIQEMFVHTVEIKGNQNVLVTFYKILFCVQQKKVSHTGLEWYESEEMITEFISSNFPAV